MALARGTVFAGFIIEATLGVGGMGTVYLARHPRLPRSDALKLLRPELSYDPDFAVRFAREADIASRLSHPNIVPVHDRGSEDGQLWISMPYVDGMDAEQALAECRGPMAAQRAVRIISEIAGALDYAHRNNQWHRDVKPANILLAPGRDDEPERALLADFGIAKTADEGSKLTKSGSFIASFDYAPPEQLEGHSFDHRVDIYALGGVLYKLLTGAVPYPSTTMAAAIYGHVTLPPPRPTDRAPWLAPGLDDVIARAMAKDPDARYPSCRALSAAAQTAVNDLPAPPPLPYSISATRTEPGSERPMILGPLDSADLSPADRDGLVALVRKTRFFNLPATLGTRSPDPADPGIRAPVLAAAAGPAATPVTISVRAAGRTAGVSYVPGVTPRPPELDDLLGGLENRLPWRPADADSRRPPPGLPAPATVLQRRSEPAALAEPPAAGRHRLVAVLISALLVIAAGGTAFILTRPASAPASDGSAVAENSTRARVPPVSSAELGLPSGPPLADAVLVAAQEVDGNVDLFAVDSTTGGTQAQLTSGPGRDFNPLIAPDRASIIYLNRRQGVIQLWVVGSDGSGARALFGAQPSGCDTLRRPAWNPVDPNMLALACFDATGTATLQLLTVSGELVDTLDPGLPQFGGLAFSPDGSSLLYWANADSAATDGPLYVLPTDGGSPPVELTEQTLAASASPLWSPDGTRIVLRARFDDGSPTANNEIVVMNADGSDPQILAADSSDDEDPAWSPDGSMIVFRSDRTDGAGFRAERLWVMNADGSGLRLLSTEPVKDGFAPAWSHR